MNTGNRHSNKKYIEIAYEEEDLFIDEDYDEDTLNRNVNYDIDDYADGEIRNINYNKYRSNTDEPVILKIHRENEENEVLENRRSVALTDTSFNNNNNYNYSDENKSNGSSITPPAFPIPTQTNTLDRTSLLNQPVQEASKKKSNWTKVKAKMIEDQDASKSSAWSGLMKAVRSAPNKTKAFLGIDSSTSIPISSKSNVPTTSASAAQLSETSMSKKANVNKTLNNWNERTFRVFNSNFIFGGKVKKEVIDKYIDNLNQEDLDETDPFVYYKRTGSNIDSSNKISVASIAANGIKKVLKVSRIFLNVFRTPF